jgi:hypothetical protein
MQRVRSVVIGLGPLCGDNRRQHDKQLSAKQNKLAAHGETLLKFRNKKKSSDKERVENDSRKSIHGESSS